LEQAIQSPDKGKPTARWGRKAKGLGQPRQPVAEGDQVRVVVVHPTRPVFALQPRQGRTSSLKAETDILAAGEFLAVGRRHGALADQHLESLRSSLFDTRSWPQGREMTLLVLGGPHRGEYEVRVLGADKATLHLSVPLCAGKPVRPAPGTPVGLRFNDRGSDCQFASTVADPEESGAGLAVLLPVEVRRLQRRGFMRLPVTVPLKAALLPAPGADRAELRFLPAVTQDLSAGGLSFSCTDLGAGPGDLLSVVLSLPGAARTVRATCQVVRRPTATGSTAVAFVDLDEGLREELTRFVARCQRMAAAGGDQERQQMPPKHAS
jgi:c-di-GMP-binding flagellar brake protein YcgR